MHTIPDQLNAHSNIFSFNFWMIAAIHLDIRFSDSCEPNPCQNNGVCKPCTSCDPAYYCNCDEGYTGINCTTSKSKRVLEVCESVVIISRFHIFILDAQVCWVCICLPKGSKSSWSSLPEGTSLWRYVNVIISLQTHATYARQASRQNQIILIIFAEIIFPIQLDISILLRVWWLLYEGYRTMHIS